MQAIVDYCNLTHDEVVGAAVRKLATAHLHDTAGWWDDICLGLAMGFSARTAQDPAPFKDWIERQIKNQYRSWYDMVSPNPAFWIGPKAYLNESKLTICHWYLHAALYDMAVLDHEPAIHPEHMKDIEVRQAEGWPKPRPRESWQTDRPPLKPQ